MTLDLKAIRAAAGLSQPEIAARIGYSPRSGRFSVIEMEGREDWLLSSIAAYIKGAGGSAELVVNVNGQELRFEI